MHRINLAQSDKKIDNCFPLMQQLRPHLIRNEFIGRIRRQEQRYNYRLACLEDAGTIKTLAGFRISECLAWGKFLYVDDLVITASDRSKGYGDAMFDWLAEYAKTHSCE